MIWRKGILITICFFMLVAVVSAEIPDIISANAPPDWLVANTVDTYTMTVHPTNWSTGGDFSDIPITFSTDDVVLGSVSPTEANTNGIGTATTTFRVNKTSGTATIRAVYTYYSG
ncbi:MAG: hypothetical protein NT112_01990, partial [Methanoregula sp.]|nr:hypothetical protein [Methanoregula sp.]